MLFAAGADAVHPWHAIAVARAIAGSRGNEELVPERAEANLLDALEHGMRKVLARMGISTLASYRGGQLFEVVGLADAVGDRCFPAAPRTAGVGHPDRSARGRRTPRELGTPPRACTRPALVDPSSRFRADGEMHAFAPAIVKATQALAAATRPAGPGTALAPAIANEAVDEQLAAYRAAVGRDEPAMVRDLLALRPVRPVPLAAVEPATEIVRRFVSSAMSLGALSPEAHRALAIGMRRLGATSNSGEGGEDPASYEPDENGEPAESSVKQVARLASG
jgi:glutamate synthase domain-containing protein 2